MENGLIFPCPCERDNGEAGDANHSCLRYGLRVVVGVRLGTDLVVAKRWGDAGG
jgi:hypothetical protein